MALEPVVVVNDLVKIYGNDLPAVNGISFTVEKGEIFGFLGPNGAGKSTTMRMLYGRTPITSGQVNILGFDPRRDGRRLRAVLGIVPQEDNLDPDLRVLQNMLVYARYFDIPRPKAMARAQEALELFQLWERRDSPVSELSGGMKRRLVIARSLINEPQLVILDEPTTGLDPQARQVVWQRLRYLAGQGVTMLLTTHYMEEATQLCSRLVIMDKGRILAEDRPHVLIQQHTHPYVLEIRRDGEDATVFREVLPDDAQVEKVGDTVYIYSPKAVDHTSLGLPPSVTTLSRQASLEDVFLRLTGRGLDEE
ncbi:MAG: ABC transporter ATP-binding protein [Anaerolineae bacterium]